MQSDEVKAPHLSVSKSKPWPFKPTPYKEDWIPLQAFTNSSTFPYVEAFLMGLNLQRQFERYADLCQEAVFEGMDEWTRF